MKEYTKIAFYLERSLDGLELPPDLIGAIKAMKCCPELLKTIKCFDEED